MASKIKAILDGPLQVSGGASVTDASGKEKTFDENNDAWLCRCGASKNKPYCDGSHKKINYKADK